MTTYDPIADTLRFAIRNTPRLATSEARTVTVEIERMLEQAALAAMSK